MGASATKENIDKKGFNIMFLNKNISDLNQRLVTRCKNTIAEIERRKYNDEDLICQRIVWSNLDELASFFPIIKVSEKTSLGQVDMRYKPGLKPESNLENSLNAKLNRNAKCKEIARLYKHKIDILNQVINKLNEKCSSMVSEKYEDLENKIKEIYKTGKPNETDNKKWFTTYQNLENINKKTINNYNVILKLLDNIREAKTVESIDSYFSSINKILAENTRLCEEHKKYFESSFSKSKSTSIFPSTYSPSPAYSPTADPTNPFYNSGANNPSDVSKWLGEINKGTAEIQGSTGELIKF